MFVNNINSFLAKNFGIRIVHTRPTFDQARSTLLEKLNIDFILDGGANRGQWASAIKREFTSVEILSIEPTLSAYQVLKEQASKDPRWETLNVALSDRVGFAEMHIANNDEQSSSLLQPRNHLKHYPSVGFERTEKVEVITLDSLYPNADSIYLKLDLQGHELSALQGGMNFLKKVAAIELEMTTLEMYEKQATFFEVATFLSNRGFQIFSFGDPFRSPDGRTTYFDAIFTRPKVKDLDNEA